MKYVIISPIKNEEKYIENTLRSVVCQTVLPLKWIIVDDGSSDNSINIINRYAQAHKFIELHVLNAYRPDLKSTGGRSGALMNYARKLIKEEVDFVVKIDTDISFSNDFFRNIFLLMQNEPSVGLASGHLVQDGLPEKLMLQTAVRGATRIYKANCFNAIGEYYTVRGEDEMDTYKAQYLGWDTKTYEVYFNHLKPEGVRNQFVRNHFETGEFKGRIPYNFVFFCATLVKNIKQRPFILGSAIQMVGYLWVRFIKRQRPFDPDLSHFIQAKQKKRMANYIYRTQK